jgi:hypothetical protein
MKATMIIGIILLVVGLIGFAYQGITYTTREKVVDIGPIEATVEKEKRLPLPPILAGLALAAGIILIVAESRRAS